MKHSQICTLIVALLSFGVRPVPPIRITWEMPQRQGRRCLIVELRTPPVSMPLPTLRHLCRRALLPAPLYMSMPVSTVMRLL